MNNWLLSFPFIFRTQIPLSFSLSAKIYQKITTQAHKHQPPLGTFCDGCQALVLHDLSWLDSINFRGVSKCQLLAPQAQFTHCARNSATWQQPTKTCTFEISNRGVMVSDFCLYDRNERNLHCRKILCHLTFNANKQRTLLSILVSSCTKEHGEPHTANNFVLEVGESPFLQTVGTLIDSVANLSIRRSLRSEMSKYIFLKHQIKYLNTLRTPKDVYLGNS